MLVALAGVLPATAGAAFPDTKPNDPLFDASPLPNATNEQWDLQSPAAGFDRGISADRAWPLSTGEGIVVGDIDLGVRLDHPDLRDRWAPGGWDFYSADADPTSDTRNPHGTQVAGVVGAATNNGIGIAGVAPGARILPLRTADHILHQGDRLAQAIVHATDHGARVLSMSLGADSFTASLRRAVRYAHRRGVVIAVASGNEFAEHHHQPQVLPEVLAVGGVNPDTANAAAADQRLAAAATRFDVHAKYANRGAHVDVVAPTQVPATEWDGYGRNWSGTSAATPHVAGVAALVLRRAKRVGLTLAAGEVRQILRLTADDLTDAGQGYAPGWDPVSGYGRVNALRAVERVAAGRIPPQATITVPFPYAPTARAFTVRGTASGRSATRWELELGRGEQPAQWTRIGAGAGRRGASLRLARVAPRDLAAGEWTLRLRVRDAAGNEGEDRVLFFADPAHDGTLRRGFPRALGTSGESSPVLADLDGRRGQEIVLATSDGLIRVLSGRTGKALRGWPQRARPRAGTRAAARRIGAVRAGFEGTPAVGNVAGDRRREIVAVALDGRVYAWTARGRRLRGFPYRIPFAGPGDDDRTTRLEAAIYASPALVDLDGDRKLDIVFGAADQRVHALRGDGRPVRGWPVLARETPDADHAKILSSPAIGDLDGDKRPDVVEGTAEVYGSTPSTTGRVYAFDRTGKRLPGWPVKPPALAADAIPLAGEGTPMSPVLADVDGDGDHEVAVGAFTGTLGLYDGDGTRRTEYESSGTGAGSPSTAPATLAFGANAAFGRLEPNGPLRLFAGGVDERIAAAQLNPARRSASSTCSAAGTRARERGPSASPSRSRGSRSSPRPRSRTSAATRARRSSPARAATSCTPSAPTAARPRAGRSRPAAGCSPRPRSATSTATGGPTSWPSRATATCSRGARPRPSPRARSGRASATTCATPGATGASARAPRAARARRPRPSPRRRTCSAAGRSRRPG